MGKFRREITEREITGREIDHAGREIPEFLRRDAAEFLRRDAAEPQEPVDERSLLRRSLGNSTQQIDGLITELRIMKERIQLESERVQREIMGYASMSQAAMESTKIIAESLTNFTKAPEAPAVSE
jgi:hypothetical protein